MSTSLGEQLKRLAAPQTTILVDSKKRPSILFDPKEAANKDRKTIFDIAHNGLMELIALNPTFLQFEQTLFDRNTIYMERSVETSQINDLLNKAIKKFFYHLSPYFMLQPAHMCLEWLIRRFHIHEFNQNEMMALILPYHETMIFVKCIQTMSFRTPENRWKWMESIKKPGVPLSKNTILNRAASDRAFLKFICQTTIEAIKELDTRGSSLQALVNFYCTTVIGALEYTNEINESHISTILPAILKGCNSKVIDFTAAAFMITAQLVSKTELSLQLLEALIEKICIVQFPTMQSDIILLLILIYQRQMENLKNFPDKGLNNLITNKWLTTVLAKLVIDEIPISVICVPLVGNCLRRVQTKDQNWLASKDFLEKLIVDVHFKEQEAKNLIRAVLDNYHKREVTKISENEIIELDSDDDDDMPLTEDIQSWYSEYLQRLERQYPSEFDFTIKETMEGKKNISESRKQALKTVLAFRLKSSYSEDNSLIYENLYHHNARNRAEAVKYLVKNVKNLTISPQGQDMVKDSLLDRLNDDNPKVVNEILKLSTENLIGILGNQLFVDRILEILYKTQNQQDNWTNVITNILGHLTKKSVFDGCDLNRILLAIIQFFLPSNDDDILHIEEILTEDFCNAIPLLKNCVELKNLQTSDEISEQFQILLKTSKNLPKPDVILVSCKDIKENFYQKSSNCSYLMLLLTASFNTNLGHPKIGLDALQLVEKIGKKFQFLTNNQNLHKSIKQNKIPLEIFLDFILAITKGTKFEEQNKFKIISESQQLILRIYEILITKTLGSENEFEKIQYSKSLKELLGILFTNTTEKLQFLSNFFIADCITNLKSNPELQIRSIKLFNAIAMGKDQSYNIDELILIKILLGLSCKISFVRALSLTTFEILAKCDNNEIENRYKIFANKILKRKEEILMDSEQFPLIFFTMISQNHSKRRNDNNDEVKAINSILDSLLTILCEKNSTENYLKANILKILKHINNFDILNKIIRVGLEILDFAEENSELIFDTSRGEIFQLIAQRFDETTIKLINNDELGWSFIERSLNLHKFLIETNKKIQSIGTIILDIFEHNVYAKITVKNKQKLLKLILNCVTFAEDNSLPSAGIKLMKRIDLDGKDVIEILESMKNSCNSPIVKRYSDTNKTVAPDPNSLNSIEWKCGITLLEYLQNKKKLENYQLLIPILFDVLKKCLDFEEQTALEYTKQLILSCLLHFCQKSTSICEISKKPSKPLPDNIFRMNLVVQCIRATQNPQTHHHALILLSHCAQIIPQQVLHNMMDIFTFMGSSVVRHDDSFSFQIISNIIESVIPTLVKANSSENPSSDQDELVVPVLKLFSDIILDVPEHRRLPLYTKLLRTLGATRYLWMFLAVLFESHVVHEDKDRLHKKSLINHENLPKRIKIALQLTNDFEPTVTLDTCMAFFTYLRKLPHDKQYVDEHTKMDVDKIEITLFDIDGHSSKQLRHFKYIILQFISTFTSTTEFLNSIAILNDDETKAMKSYYQNFIIKILSYIPEVTITMEKNNDTNQMQFCKVMLHHCYDILDNSISLLSPDMFLVVVHGLMLHQIPSVRKKVIDLLINKLQYKSDYFDNCNEENLLNLLEPLNKIIDTIATKEKLMENASSTDIVFIQQLSLIAIKLLSKLMAVKYIEEFKFILNKLTKITKKRSTISKIVLAAIVLAITEISSNLRAHSISHLPKFMPILIEVLQDQADYLTSQPPDYVCVGIVAGMQKLFETLPLFLGPYMVDVITTLITIWTRVLPYQEHEPRSTVVVNKLKSIWSKIATTVPMRVLIPNCEKTYTKLFETQQYSGIGYLMKILIECFEHNPGQEINSHHNELTLFFLQALEFRVDLTEQNVNQNEINEIEEQILEAFVALILKLSESSFRPLYQKVYDWALRDSTMPDKAITYFLLSSKISEALKSLFVLFASDFIQNAADLLDKCNSIKFENNESYFIGENSIEKSIILIENILKTLYNVFLHDSKGFVNPHRFDILMQPISDQLENSICLNNDVLQMILLKCISQFALVVSNDTLWKQLNYQVLLKTRSNRPEVRILAFNCCIEIARKLGDDFSSLLPETIPFVAELFEDEQQKVEKNTRKGVQELEKILGESLQKYF